MIDIVDRFKVIDSNVPSKHGTVVHLPDTYLTFCFLKSKSISTCNTVWWIIIRDLCAHMLNQELNIE
jgi:hypothetical protein